MIVCKNELCDRNVPHATGCDFYEDVTVCGIWKQHQTEQAEASSLSDLLDAEAELKRLFDTVEQVIKTSKPVEPLGVVCSSRAAWQALMNAYEFYKAEGI